MPRPRRSRPTPWSSWTTWPRTASPSPCLEAPVLKTGTPRIGGRLFALRVLLFAMAVPLLLRRHLARLAPLLEPATVPPPPPPGVVDVMVLRIDRLLLAGRPLVRSGCLTRGITLFYFLRRAGPDVSLRFGMGEGA